MVSRQAHLRLAMGPESRNHARRGHLPGCDQKQCACPLPLHADPERLASRIPCRATPGRLLRRPVQSTPRRSREGVRPHRRPVSGTVGFLSTGQADQRQPPSQSSRHTAPSPRETLVFGDQKPLPPFPHPGRGTGGRRAPGMAPVRLCPRPPKAGRRWPRSREEAILPSSTCFVSPSGQSSSVSPVSRTTFLTWILRSPSPPPTKLHRRVLHRDRAASYSVIFPFSTRRRATVWSEVICSRVRERKR